MVGKESFPPSSHACKAPKWKPPRTLSPCWETIDDEATSVCPSLTVEVRKPTFISGPSHSPHPALLIQLQAISHSLVYLYFVGSLFAEGMDMMNWPSSAHSTLIQEGGLIITNHSQFSKRHSVTKQYCPALQEGPLPPHSAGCCLRGNLPHFPFAPGLL